MSVKARANLVVGISILELCDNFREENKTHDEYDKFGKKTGKQFTINRFFATLPNGKEIMLSDRKDKDSWKYNIYESLNFDCDMYVGDKPNITLELNYGNEDNDSLEELIIGFKVCETQSSDYIGNILVKKVNENSTNNAIEKCRKELGELYGYLGAINLYLINSVSY